MKLFAILLAIFCFACNAPHPDSGYYQPTDTAPTYVLKPYSISGLDSAVIYCWCFENGHSSCLTFKRVLPAELCKSSHRLLVMDGFVHMAGFQNLINKAKSQSNHLGDFTDTRFVIKCYRRDSTFLLTYYDDSTLLVDEKRELICPKPILAWIMSEMNLSEIDCPN